MKNYEKNCVLIGPSRCFDCDVGLRIRQSLRRLSAVHVEACRIVIMGLTQTCPAGELAAPAVPARRQSLRRDLVMVSGRAGVRTAWRSGVEGRLDLPVSGRDGVAESGDEAVDCDHQANADWARGFEPQC